MIVSIKRIALKETYTIGKVYVDGVYVCDSIEDKVRDVNKNGKFDGPEQKIYGLTAIPYGTYKADIFFSKKFGYKVVRLFDVPSFEGIYIHKGNTEKDSLGCIIVGFNDKKGWVSRPTEALNKLIDKIGYFKFQVVIS